MSANSATLHPGVIRRLLRNRAAVVALAILGAVVFIALFGPLIFHYVPEATSLAKNAPPSAEHWFGTDLNGRDVFSRVIQGARISLLVGFLGAMVSFFVGTAYGLISGYAGGRVDNVMMRFVEILYSVPRLILVIVAIFAFEEPLGNRLYSLFPGLVGYSKVVILILCLGLIEWLSMARIVRGQVLALKEQQFVLAARSLGQSHARILVRHLLPNLVGVVVVYLTLTIPAVILDESFLSFLGLGVNDPQASWGSLLSDGKNVINPVKSFWWLLLFPAAAMSITLLALNFLGDALRDALDPRARR
jgi:peptide/nickel transport system permease protein/oligopeptide transport system permease protein